MEKKQSLHYPSEGLQGNRYYRTAVCIKQAILRTRITNPHCTGVRCREIDDNTPSMKVPPTVARCKSRASRLWNQGIQREEEKSGEGRRRKRRGRKGEMHSIHDVKPWRACKNDLHLEFRRVTGESNVIIDASPIYLLHRKSYLPHRLRKRDFSLHHVTVPAFHNGWITQATLSSS